ncbi:hypothetical protein N7462_007008 [Penicillium macrosclerotiorum]|uniref:uncharacterized protein n=1 Tax=Penicillium macrosclerotiorum TaxID=303699 RepID=UPI0025482674|nr:uncharacterized protein N7462_007008 [Penicillium macrosclerotiorum]KAJ5678764.1 hypothetical protein N7462_007008 [Penicillium macrosclerotiorum]
MGHKFTVITGVKSSNFYEQGNAINEIWLGNVEVISRLPFGDSDLGQAGWPSGDWPKIPWHQFVIPLKRDLESSNTAVMASNGSLCTCTCPKINVPDFGFGYFTFYQNWDKMYTFFAGLGMAWMGYLMCQTFILAKSHIGLSEEADTLISHPQSHMRSLRSWVLLAAKSFGIGLILFYLGLYILNEAGYLLLASVKNISAPALTLFIMTYFVCKVTVEIFFAFLIALLTLLWKLRQNHARHRLLDTESCIATETSLQSVYVNEDMQCPEKPPLDGEFV